MAGKQIPGELWPCGNESFAAIATAHTHEPLPLPSLSLTLSLAPSLSPSVWYLVNGLVQLRLLQGKTMRRHKAKPETKTEAETNWKSKSKSINACLGGPSPPLSLPPSLPLPLHYPV